MVEGEGEGRRTIRQHRQLFVYTRDCDSATTATAIAAASQLNSFYPVLTYYSINRPWIIITVPKLFFYLPGLREQLAARCACVRISWYLLLILLSLLPRGSRPINRLDSKNDHVSRIHFWFSFYFYFTSTVLPFTLFLGYASFPERFWSTFPSRFNERALFSSPFLLSVFLRSSVYQWTFWKHGFILTNTTRRSITGEYIFSGKYSTVLQ